MNIPQNLLYTKDHEWIRVEGNKITLGITDFAQNQLGDVVFVDTPTSQTEYKIGDSLCSVESVKAVSDVYAPVSGMIINVNQNLANSPQSLNEDPYGKGWIAVMQMTNSIEDLKTLLDAAGYAKLLAEEA